MWKNKEKVHFLVFLVWINFAKAFLSRPCSSSSRWWIKSFDTTTQAIRQRSTISYIRRKSTSTEIFISSMLNDLSGTLNKIKETKNDSVRVGENDDDDDNDSENDIFPFVIQRLERTNEKIFREISEMCIETFFNEDTLLPEEDKGQGSLPFKGLQLAYLKNLQYSDLKSRMFVSMTPYKSDMLVARRVFCQPSNTTSTSSKALVSKLTLNKNQINELTSIQQSDIFNNKYLTKGKNEEYTLGEVIGFCEISARPIRVPAKDFYKNTDTENMEANLDENEKMKDTNNNRKPRSAPPLSPLLTNLAVKKSARRSGVGSRLLSTCEDVVTSKWEPSYKELTLQVEEDNMNAIKFYEKRGYQTLYADKTAQRFDTTGLFLRKVRSTKIFMKKNLNQQQSNRSQNLKQFWANFLFK